ncbi:MAG: 4Fe-4S dicluster domain-containing protein [Campylobacterales bacterium]|nr:4Fe-4S dicluster domain-containing protein [Campylobacterales bacterium]
MSLLSPANAIKIESLRCLRIEHVSNECSKCIDLCPTEAIGLSTSRRISLDSTKCVGCMACIGVCPTETFVYPDFDPAVFVLQTGIKKDITLSCKNNNACLGIFNSEYFISLGLRHDSVNCDMSLCSECDMNLSGKISVTIEEHINEANRFLQAVDKPSIAISKEQNKLSRREALFSFVKDVNTLRNEESFDELFDPKESLPKSRTVFQNSLKLAIEELPPKPILEKFSFISHKQIDFISCDNCGDCIQFCPTKALQYNSDKTKILFQPLRCIACGICDDVCKPKAISSDSVFDVVTLAFNRAELLIEHHFEVCSECRVSFPQKGNETICARCESFVQDHSDLFGLARDM